MKTIIPGDLISFDYITEFRIAINNVRNKHGLDNYIFLGTSIYRSSTLQELRMAIDEVYTLLNKTYHWSSLTSKGEFAFFKFRVMVDTDAYIDAPTISTGMTFNGLWYSLTDLNNASIETKVSNAIGSYVEYTFNGRGIECYGDVGIDSGKVKLTIDDYSTVLDLCRRESISKKLIFDKINLENTQHTIKIELLGSSNMFIDAKYFNEIQTALINL